MIAQKKRTRTANPGAQLEALQNSKATRSTKTRDTYQTPGKPSGHLDRVPQPPTVSAGNRTKPTQHRRRPTPEPKAKKPKGRKAGRRHARTGYRSPSKISPTAARFFIITFIYYIIQSIDYMPRYIYILLLYWYFIIEIYILSVFIGNICHLYI